MIVQANSHLGFHCRDLDKSIRFYRDVLGCKEKFSLYYGDLIPQEPERLAEMPRADRERLEALKGVRWIVYMEMLDGYFIELFNEVSAHIENPYNPENYGFTHFSFVVDDIQSFYQELLDKGAEDCIELPPAPTVDRNYAMWIHDPDGNRIEVHQYTEKAMQKIGR